MSNLTRVREALESLRRVAPTQDYEDDADVALDDLTAHEQEVRELVEKIARIASECKQNWEEWTDHGYGGSDVIRFVRETNESLNAALRPFGDEK